MASQAALMYGQSAQPDPLAAGGGGSFMGAAAPWLMGGLAALQAGGAVGGLLSGRKAKKRARAREERILASIDSGASQAKGNYLATLPSVQGAATQNMISRGLVNSSAASDAASAAASGVGNQMAQVDQQAARDKAAVSTDFAGLDGGGGGGNPGAGLAQSGATIGALLASNLSAKEGGAGGEGGAGQPLLGGTQTGQMAGKPDAVDITGGDPGLTSSSVRGAYDGGAADPTWAGMPLAQSDALSAVKRARSAKPRGMAGRGTMSRADRILAMGR